MNYFRYLALDYVLGFIDKVDDLSVSLYLRSVHAKLVKNIGYG